MTQPKSLLFRGSFNRAVVRDTARHAIPANGVYDSADYLLERPGMAYKRGGFERHSLLAGANTTMSAVATIHIPTRVVAVGGTDGHLYDVTSESGPQADNIGACFSPGENPPLYANELIFCDPAASGVPKTVFWNSGGSTIAISTLFAGAAFAASHAIVHESYVMQGRGSVASGLLNWVWFPPDPALEPTVVLANTGIDTSHEVTGLASCSGVALIFSPVSIERLLGSIPPGRVGENMELQPLAGVGCLDARSIVHLDEAVIFAGQEGVWLTNGAGVVSLTQKPDGTGIQSYWRSLFPAKTIRQIVGGLLSREFYKVDVLDSANGSVAELLCHIPSRSWVRLTNTANRMYAQGRTESETLELYGASNVTGYVNRFTSMLTPDWAHRADGDGTAVLPMLEVPFGDAGVLKSFSQARVTHVLTAGVATVWQAAHVYAINDQILANSQVWQVTARSSDFKSGALIPAFGTDPDFGDVVVDNHVTWTSVGPQLVVSTATGLNPTAFTQQEDFELTDGKRGWYTILADNQQTVSVRLTQLGGSATTEIHGLEVDVRVYEPGVSGSE